MKSIYLKYIKWSIVLGLLIFLVVKSIWMSDNELPKVEVWLRSNVQVIENTGTIRGISIKKSTYVSESSNTIGYKKYTFLVKGEKSNKIVRVKVTGDNKYEIIVIE